MVTLKNTFHHTTARVRPRPDGTLSERAQRRAWRKLCGMADCACWHVEVEGPYTLEERWVERESRYAVRIVSNDALAQFAVAVESHNLPRAAHIAMYASEADKDRIEAEYGPDAISWLAQEYM